jgi:YHS domain-containing protein
MVRDPICRRVVRPARETPTAVFRRRTFHFCSEACRNRFDDWVLVAETRESARNGTLLAPGRVRWGMA